jgi:hypothetical protein
VLAGLAAASVQGTVALGPNRGARLRRLGHAPESVEASALEVAADRSLVTNDGQVQLQLRHQWTDGTTHLVFDAVARVLGDYADNLSFNALELHDRSSGASPQIANLWPGGGQRVRYRICRQPRPA